MVVKIPLFPKRYISEIPYNIVGAKSGNIPIVLKKSLNFMFVLVIAYEYINAKHSDIKDETVDTKIEFLNDAIRLGFSTYLLKFEIPIKFPFVSINAFFNNDTNGNNINTISTITEKIKKYFCIVLSLILLLFFDVIIYSPLAIKHIPLIYIVQFLL
ncbi:hypothetical protein QS9_3681 [Clostridioides difficile P20]|nr:hypothetical protein QKY_3557 [Clostridioides difficile DA00211]EQJ31951.1 hypothetical protein QS9_3681 [Clostridioides difficile P20]